MKSPFPGMDPYIEACDLWEDIQDDLIVEIKRSLSTLLPRGYLARTGKRCYVVLADTEGKVNRSFLPDVGLTAKDRPEAPRRKVDAQAAVIAATPAESRSMRAFIEAEYEERFIDIYELKPERRLVTSIEVLSPSNKRRRTLGWKKYLRKRQGLLLGKANLVEIDLLRGGERMPMFDPWPEGPYALLVAREEEAPDCRVWPASFDRQLPTIPVPLRRPDADLPLALQPSIDAIYDRGRYDEEIDYARQLVPPLRNEEAAWVQQRLRQGTSASGPSGRKPRKRRK
jgi:Protein of unknown function (DUF4058)